MPFDIGKSINYFADLFLNSPTIKKIAENPIYTALMITFVIMLIILYVFREIQSDDSLFVLTIRSGFWVFLMLVGALFLHNKVLETRETEFDTIFKGSNEPTFHLFEDSVVPVNLNYQ